MQVRINSNIIMVLISAVSLVSCADRVNPSRQENLDFDKYFDKIKSLDFVNEIGEMVYFGPTRGNNRMSISYFDGTNAAFSLDDYENVNIISEGNSGKINEQRIVGDIKRIIVAFKELSLQNISTSLSDSIIDIEFSLSAIRKESLPEYHAPKILEKFHYNKGELIHSLGNNFEKTELYESFKFVKLEEHWYFAYY